MKELECILGCLFFLLATVFASSAGQQNNPWQEALTKQLAELHGQQNVVVVHLGINQRAAEANVIAKSLSDFLGQPVIALPSYGGESGHDFGNTVAQYAYKNNYPGNFEQAWQQIIDHNHKIVGEVFYSGGGFGGNYGAKALAQFIKNHPGKVSGNVVFVNTNMNGITQKEFSKVGIHAVHIGRDDTVSWVTKTSQQFFPLGESFGPLSFIPTIIGTPVKWSMGLLRTVPPVGSAISRHGLLERKNELKKALNLKPSSAPATQAAATGELGGIDFSELEMRYLSEGQIDKLYLMQSAFRAIPAVKPDLAIDRERLSGLSWGSLAVWLALPNSSFWVNLNPSEPNRIIDPELGKTDSGRILLEADLQLKRDSARFKHPHTNLGKEFWNKIYERAVEGQKPGSKIEIPTMSTRLWIVPGKVVVWATDTNIYIVEAKLDVKSEAKYLSDKAEKKSFLSSLFGKDKATKLQEYAEELNQKMIMPLIINEVNNGPAYRELRQVFYSRIIAEWIKTGHHSPQTVFAKIIGQGYADPWRSSKPWSGREIFDRYRTSCAKGEYSITDVSTKKTPISGGWLTTTTSRYYFSGGVDFSSVPMTNITYAQLLSRRPKLEQELSGALSELDGYQGDNENWIGGIFAVGKP